MAGDSLQREKMSMKTTQVRVTVLLKAEASESEAVESTR